MNRKSTRRIGLRVLLITAVLGGLFLPALYPGYVASAEGGALHRTIQQLALAHLFAGAIGGFALALLVWPFRSTDP